jgi:hypothetical protein
VQSRAYSGQALDELCLSGRVAKNFITNRIVRQQRGGLCNQLRPEYFLQLYLYYAADKSTAPLSKRESIVFN